MKIAFIGGGNMAAALIGGMIRKGVAASDVYAIDPNAHARARNAEQFGIRTGEAADATLAQYDAVVLAVKPQIVKSVAEGLAPHLAAHQLVISIVAGIRSADLSRWLNGHARIVRTMPNTPALIGMGAAGLVASAGVDEAGRQLASDVLGAVGQAVWFDDEAKIDAVTAISGSGPAYVFYFIEALEEAARRLGMDEQQGRALAIATFTGAAQLALQSSEPPAVLRERVTSKGGTTAAALASFDASGVKEAIVRGALAADARAKEMGDEFGRQ
ncbi:pyrroline-5-carboxylate reductase [Paraburkholderia caballeronis]|uniref:Pyrroline-5-carboxylate reductase n=1 Tax=Paraburkholderia caballeronis TaxID=416943 RepID=A0A1H7I881_9BURK|nr:pyrroline-5-carboxylate reductase [Paraburkholderia caballeronis]PXW29181.1 pyrroline-5-carboxylate reductase [Paraburkholderia caballeronis]PXX04440.1 pyrroline-5-carboxylate reductase [Paraburkholderia caballeronis]RAK05501.1 pyrroline-5-carboxylate reductase [Paraburkholderia caballeronis]SEC90064.1 pyrroline-5-carboxylate reductase [Paraburkholderia caballeronis]SEK58574.1 pyrroline-5-carboxylate reductase [Paraburkholderia caballeronis]